MNGSIVKKYLMIIIMILVSSAISFGQDVPKAPDAPKAPDDATKAGKDAGKMFDNVNKLKKEKEKLPKPKGPVVAFLPFNYTYAVGEQKALIISNEIVVAMVKSQKFTPTSLKKWADSKFKDGNGRDIHYIIGQMQTFKVPADFVCHGSIFKSGDEYGLKIALFPVTKKVPVTYYFRTFKNFNDITNIAAQILAEMSERGLSKATPQTGKKILINTFDLNYLFYTRSETGDINISPLPFIKIGQVEYKKEDFFNELMLYNFHIDRLYSVYNNNITEYTANSRYRATIGYDYVINASFNISQELKTCIIDVYSGTDSSLLFEKTYRFDKLGTTYLYQEMRKWVKDISLTLLSTAELKQVGEVQIDSLHRDEMVYFDDYYLGNGDQGNLLVPINNSGKVKIWTGETMFTLKSQAASNYKERYLNVSPFLAGVSKSSRETFALSVGGTFLTGFYFHPQYNDKQKVIFHNTVDDSYKYYDLGDILESSVVENDFEYMPSYLIGAGADFTLENKYFMMSHQINIKGGHYENEFEIKPDKEIDINSTPIDDLDITYKLLKINLDIDYSFLPAVLFLKPESRIRLYAGAGLFTALWYNYYNEEIAGTANMDSTDYILNNAIESRQSLNLVLGAFPEIGVIFKLDRFNIKTGISYYFDLYKYNLATNSEYGDLETFSTSKFIYKLSFSYYLK